MKLKCFALTMVLVMAVAFTGCSAGRDDTPGSMEPTNSVSSNDGVNSARPDDRVQNSAGVGNDATQGGGAGGTNDRNNDGLPDGDTDRDHPGRDDGIDDVGDAVGDVVKGAGNAARSAGDAIGNAANDVGRAMR